MAPYVYDNASLQKAMSMSAEERKSMVTTIATREGVFAGTLTLAGWGGTLLLLKRANVFPNLRLNASAKTGILIMPPLLVFSLVSEQIASRMANPGAFAQYVTEKKVSALPPHQRIANFVLHEPYKILFGGGIAAVALIFTNKSRDTGLTLSQRIMHTRVLAQFSVLVALGTVMGFREWMRSRGPYLEPWEIDENKKQE
jgi:hypothetical protein